MPWPFDVATGVGFGERALRVAVLVGATMVLPLESVLLDALDGVREILEAVDRREREVIRVDVSDGA